jgi:hypothetical protein
MCRGATTGTPFAYDPSPETEARVSISLDTRRFSPRSILWTRPLSASALRRSLTYMVSPARPTSYPWHTGKRGYEVGVRVDMTLLRRGVKGNYDG